MVRGEQAWTLLFAESVQADNIGLSGRPGLGFGFTRVGVFRRAGWGGFENGRPAGVGRVSVGRLGVRLGGVRVLILPQRWGVRRLVVEGRKMELEAHRGVDEIRHGIERDRKARGRAVETERDGEAFLRDLKVGELMLEDDGHPLWILSEEPLRDVDARRLGGELDVEMMLPGGRAKVGGHLQDIANNPPQRPVGQILVVYLNVALDIAHGNRLSYFSCCGFCGR